MFVGHAHPEVTEAVLTQVPQGTTFFANNATGIHLAEAICQPLPRADNVRFVSAASAATLSAVRIARTHRRRRRTLKYDAGDHGVIAYALLRLAPPPLVAAHTS